MVGPIYNGVMKEHRSPPRLVQTVMDEIDRLGSMKIDDLRAQNDVRFMELLDYAFTLKNEIEDLRTNNTEKADE